MENYKFLEGEVGWEITLADVANQNKFIINSYGGDVDAGYAVHDYLSHTANSEVGVMGVCASSATIILLGASKRWASKNSIFLIHNPWTMSVGDSSELSKTAEELKGVENKLVGLYNEKLNASEEFIRDLMKEERFIDAQEALDLGLINEIREDELQPLEGETAKAMFFNLKRSNKMTKEELKKELESSEKSILNKITNFLKGKGQIKAIVLQDATGSEIDFDVETEEEIAIGVTATVDGTAANGEYTMPDGNIYVFENGTLTEINMPGDDNNEEMEALKAEIEALKAEKAESEASHETAIAEVKNQYESKLNEIKAEVAEIKNTFSGKISALDIPDSDEAGSKTVRRSRK